MASSWGLSWLLSWLGWGTSTADPNALRGAAQFRITCSGTITTVEHVPGARFITFRTKSRYGMAEQFDIEILQGDDFFWEITVQDAAGVPLNLTGYTIRGQGRKKYSDVAASFSFTCTPDPDQAGNPGGVNVELSSASSAGVAAGAYKYDLEIMTAGNKVTKLYRGTAVVVPEATKL